MLGFENGNSAICVESLTNSGTKVILNHEEMFPRYYILYTVCSMFKSSTTSYCVVS